MSSRNKLIEYFKKHEKDYINSTKKYYKIHGELLNLDDYESLRLLEYWIESYKTEIAQYLEFIEKSSDKTLEIILQKYTLHKSIILNKYVFITTLLKAFNGLDFYNSFVKNKNDKKHFSDRKKTRIKNMKTFINNGNLDKSINHTEPKPPKEIAEYLYSELFPYITKKKNLKKIVMDCMQLKSFNYSYKAPKKIVHSELMNDTVSLNSLPKLKIKNPLKK